MNRTPAPAVPPPVTALIDCCLQGKQACWRTLWPLITSAAREPLRRLVWAYHLDAAVVEDLEQELYLYLQARSGFRLRAFRGRDPAQFRAYIRRVSQQFASRWLARWQQSVRREAAAWEAAGPLRVSTTTAGQVAAVYRELLVLLRAAERAGLEAFLEQDDCPASGHSGGHGGPAPGPCPRTERRQVERLYQNCAARLL
jgi:hypothetical protein